jgi:hypothetical protein
VKQSLLNALRKGTKVAIKIDSHPIVLVPHLRVNQGHGTWTLVAQPPRDEQMFSVEPNSSTLSGISGAGGGVTSTEGATVHSWAYELVGPYNSQMEINDTWVEDGTIYRITAIQPFNDYERRGVIAAIGKDPSYGS